MYVYPLLVTISPGNVMTVRSGQTQSYSATVSGSGTPSQAVTWKVDGIANGNGSVGTITTSGVYTAPNTPGDHTITATSQQDGSAAGNVTVHVPGWVLVWKRDIVYLGTREAAEFDTAGMHVTQVDHLGSPRIVTGPSGSLESQQKYLPYGELLEQVKQGPNSITTAKGYTGHEQTDPSGLIYMQARFYLPQYGRFASPDPARDQHFEETQSWNIYSYVRNSPIMSTDPTGMETTVDTTSPSKPRSASEAMQPDGSNPVLTQGKAETAQTEKKGFLSQFGDAISGFVKDVVDWFHTPITPTAVAATQGVTDGGVESDRSAAAVAGGNRAGVTEGIKTGVEGARTALDVTYAVGIGALGSRAGSAADAILDAGLAGKLQKLVGKADAAKFEKAIEKGIVGPSNQSGIKVLSKALNGYTHELKISGSAQRILGRANSDGQLVFDYFVRGGLH